MNDRESSRTVWVLVGVVAGMVVGTWSPAGPLVAGGLGALIAAVLTSPSSTRDGGERAIREFLERAFLSGVLDEETYRRLLERLPDKVSVAAATTSRAAKTATRDVFAPPAPQMPIPSQPVPPAPSGHSSTVTTPPSPRSPSRPTRSDQRPVASSATLRRSSRPKSLLDAAPFLRPVATFWRSLRADFGVQGLGSLGVLLVFTATLGFVIFAFSEVGTSFRPVAELMVPVVLFGLSRFLRGRSAPFMAAALEGLAGAVTPIMVFAAFMDGAPVPPDPERAGLVAVLSVAALGLAAVYGWTSVRRASSPLRYLVAPLTWLAVGVLGMAIDEQASAAMFSLVLVAVAATPWIPSRHPASALRQAAEAMVVPGLIVTYTFLLVFGLAEDWPLWPILIGGIAAVGALEGSRERVPRVWIAQAAVVAITATAASVGFGAPWAGALAVGAALALGERWLVADAGRISLAGFAAVAAAGALAAIAAPGPLLVVGLAFSAWAHARRIVPDSQLGVVPDVVGAVAPSIAFVALGWLTDPWIGLVALAGALLALAVFVRTRMPSDAYLARGIAGYAAILGVAGVAGEFTDLIGEPGFVAGALAVTAIAVTVVPGRVDVRVWLASALTVAAWFVAGVAAGWPDPTVAFGLAAAGVVLVMVALRVSGSAGGHVAMVGHVVGVIALPMITDDPARIAVLAAIILGWFVEVAAEPTRSPLQRLVGSPDVTDASWVAALPVLGGLPLLALTIVAETHPSAGFAGGALVLAGTAVGYGLVAGLPIWRHALTQQAVIIGVGASVISLVIAAAFDPLMASDRALQVTAVSSGILGVVFSARRARPAMHWYAWTLTAPLAALTGLAAGVAVDDLHWVAIAWGALVSIAALIADDAIAGRRDPYLVRTWWLMPPLVVGVLTGAAGIGVGLVTPVSQMWPAAVAAAAWSGVLAYLVRAGAITYATWAAAALAYASALVDGGFDPLGDPALLTWAALFLLALGVALPQRSEFGRLDAPPLVVGLAVGAVAVGAGFVTDDTALTWVPIGGALLAVAAIKRQWVALAPLGSLLVIGAAGIEGPWHLTAALAAHAVGLGVLARLIEDAAARVAQWTSALLGAGAWASAIWAFDLGIDHAVAATAAISSLVAAVASVLVARHPHTARHAQWSGPWVAVSLVGLSLAGAVGVAEPAMAGARWSLAAASIIWLAATCVAATRLDVEELRLATLTFVGASVTFVGWAGEFSVEAWSIWTLSLAAVVTTAGAAAAAAIGRLGWRNWFVAGAGGLHIAGTVFAAQLLPDRSLLILALLAFGGASVVADLVFGIRGARLVAPGFGFGAWIAFVAELGSADVQWYAPPFALAVIIDLELLRRQRRRSGAARASTEEMVVIELVAMALAIGPALVQVVFDHLAYGLLAIVWGAGAAVWGTATRVRRRVIAGGGGAVLGALLMIAVPLADLLPEFRGPTLWVAVFAVGAVLIAVAATLEQTRRRLVELRSSFTAMTEGWE